MKVFTSLLLLSCLIAVMLAADCNNPLAAAYSITKLDTAATLTGATYCKSLQTKSACCTAAVINTFQTKVKTLTDKLSTSVGARDKAIVEARDKTIPTISTKLKTVKDQATKAQAAIAAKTDAQKTADKSTVKDDKATAVLKSVQTVATQVTDSLSTLTSSFKDFQKARTTCITQLIKLQAAAWCAACDPDYATKGVATNGAITLSAKACTRLTTGCYKYVQASAAQSNILSGASLSTILDDLTTSMTTIVTNADNNSGKLDFKTALDKLTKNSDTKVTTDKKASAIPDSCTETKCDWICTSLFKTNAVDTDAATVAGTASTALDSPVAARLLEADIFGVVEGKLSKNRMLQANEFDPAEDEAGVDATFPDDPAGVSPTTTPAATPASGLSLEKSVVALIVMTVSAFFM